MTILLKGGGGVIQVFKQFAKNIGATETIICDEVGEKDLTIYENSAAMLVQP